STETDKKTDSGYSGDGILFGLVDAYAGCIDDQSVYERVAEELEEPVNLAYLRELVDVKINNGRNQIQFGFPDGMLIEFSAIGPDETIPRLLIQSIQKRVEDRKESINLVIGEHKIEQINSVEGHYYVDINLKENTEGFRDSLIKLQDLEMKKKNELNDLKSPVKRTLTRSSVLKNALKYTVFGGLMGVFLSACLICVGYLCSDPLVDEDSLKKMYGVRVLGKYFEYNEQSIFSFIDRRVEQLEGFKPKEADKNQVFAVIAAEIGLIEKDKSGILFAGNSSKENIKFVYDNVIAKSKDNDGMYILGGDILTDPETIQKLRLVEAVIMVEDLHKTKMSHFTKSLDIIRAAGKDVLGIIEIRRTKNECAA
nr:hypothetical protein [Lachnospiraceae bacterium]